MDEKKQVEKESAGSIVVGVLVSAMCIVVMFIILNTIFNEMNIPSTSNIRLFPYAVSIMLVLLFVGDVIHNNIETDLKQNKKEWVKLKEFAVFSVGLVSIIFSFVSLVYFSNAFLDFLSTPKDSLLYWIPWLMAMPLFGVFGLRIFVKSAEA